MVDNVMCIDGKKFMWDGGEYPDTGTAKAKADEYSKAGFEVKLLEHDGKHYVYSRRVVTATPQ
jgi:hypothetical protein